MFFRFLTVEVYERYVEDSLLSVCSEQRNESFFARLNVVALIFRLFIRVYVCSLGFMAKRTITH